LTGGAVGVLAGGPLGLLVGAGAGAIGGSLLPEGADQIAFNALGMEHNVAQNTLSGAGLANGSQAANTGRGAAATRGSGSSAPPAVTKRSDLVKQAQADLKHQGLYHGRIDGIIGPQTERALTAYQQKEGLPQTAALDQATMDKLNLNREQATSPQNQQNRTAQGGQNAVPGSAASAGAMSESQVRDRLQSEGYSDISNLHQVNQNTFAAQAAKDGATYNVQVDAQSGRIVAQSAAGNEGSSANPSANPPSSGNSESGNTTPSNPGSGNTGAGAGNTGPAGH
jgi:peptidoglycan hydrolase-like protein with peptidoglycan-binding domain